MSSAAKRVAVHAGRRRDCVTTTLSRPHRQQQRLSSVQRLNITLLINAQHRLRRVQVETHNVGRLQVRWDQC